MQWIWLVVVGFVAGLIARFLVPGPDPIGILITIVLGITGSLVGTLLGQWIGIYDSGQIAGLAMQVIGAMIILVLARLVPTRTV